MNIFWNDVVEKIKTLEPGTAQLVNCFPCLFEIRGNFAVLTYYPKEEVNPGIAYSKLEVDFIKQIIRRKFHLIELAISEIKSEKVSLSLQFEHLQKYSLKELTSKDKILHLTKMQIRIMQKIGGWDAWNPWPEHDWIESLEPPDRLYLAGAIIRELQQSQIFAC